MVLKSVLHRPMGLNWFIDSGFATFGMRQTRVELRSEGIFLDWKMPLMNLVIEGPKVSQNF